MNLVLNTPPAMLNDAFMRLACDHLRRRVLINEESPPSTTWPQDIDYIRQCADAAIASVDGPQNSIRRALLTQSWSLFLDGFPSVIEIPLSPVQAVTCIKYRDASGDWHQISSLKYRVSAAHSWQPKISPAPNEYWPAAQSGSETVEVRFRAGFGDDHTDLPTPITQAILELCAQFYTERRPVIVGTTSSELPFGVKHLLQPYRVFR